MSKTEFQLYGYKCKLEHSNYLADNSPSIMLYILNTEYDEWIDDISLTVCLPNSSVILNEDEYLIKTWSENEQLAEFTLHEGLFEDTLKRVPTGFVSASIWKITNKGREYFELEPKLT